MPVPDISEPVATCAVRVRRACTADKASLFDLEAASFPGDRISRQSWSRLLASPSATVAVAERAGTPLGAVVLLYRAGSLVARVYSLAVCRMARRTGIATALLTYAAGSARAKRCAVLRLETRTDNLQAQAVFARLGFAEFARRENYYEDGAAAIRYQKYLRDAGHATNEVALHSPHCAQTLDFACSPRASA